MSETVIALRGSAERLYRRGSKAAYGGDYQTAIFYLQQAVGKEPGNLVYLTDLVAAFNQLAYYEETIAYGSYAEEMEQSDENRAVLCFFLGEAYYCFSLLEQSEAYMQRSLQLAPQGRYSKDAELYLTDIERIRSEELEIQDEGSKNAEEYRLHYARMYYAMGDLETAMRYLARYSEKCGETAESLEILNGILIAEKDYDAALECTKKLLRLESGSCIAFVLGMTAACLAGREELFEYYGKQLLEIREFMPDEKEYIFNMFDSMADDEFAKRFFVQNYRDNIYDKDIVYGFAASEYNLGDRERAEELLRVLEQLEGGLCLASYYIRQMHSVEPALRMQYNYRPTVEILEEMHSDFYRITAETPLSEEHEIELCRLTEILLEYINTEYIQDLLVELPIDNKRIRRTLEIIMLRLSEDPQRKLAIAENLYHRGGRFRVNLGGRPVEAEQLLDPDGRAAIRQFEITERLSREYTEEQIVYGCMKMVEYPELLRLLADHDEYALLVEILIRDKFGGKENMPMCELFKCYGLTSEKIETLTAMLKEKGLYEDGRADRL